MNVFEGATTPQEIDRRYRAEFISQSCQTDRAAYWALSEAHRRAHETIVFGTRNETVKTEALGQSEHVITGEPTAGMIRNWARTAGVVVGERGRIHPDIRAKYDEAHKR